METPEAPLRLPGTIDGSEAAKSEIRASILEGDSNRKMIWGLYAVYAAIGTVNGFFATYTQGGLLCQSIFGPLGTATTQDQCNVAFSVFQISWNFKLFLGFFLDNFSFFGSRRKGWILFGWTGGLIMLAFIAIMVPSFINEKFDGGFEKWVFSLMAMCWFYTFADVAGDGFVIEVSKFEPEERRGHILTTCQMCRFVAMTSVTTFGFIFMSGKSYQDASGAGGFELPFELPFNVIHWCLLIFALPSYAIIWLYLKDPPVAEDDLHAVRGCAGMGAAFGRLWQSLKSYAMFMLLVQSVGILALASMPNPANQLIYDVAGTTAFQSNLGNTLGNALFVFGVFLFRKYLLKKNWRITLLFTHGALAVASISSVMIIYNTFGAQNGWFYMWQNSLPFIIQGLCQVLSSLAVIEIAPPGLEATVYELIISCMNSAGTLALALQTSLSDYFDMHAIAQGHWEAHGCSAHNASVPDAICHTYTHHMSNASIVTICVNVISILVFMWFMPKNAEQCREWASKSSWKTPMVGCLNLIIYAVPFIYANTDVVLKLQKRS